MRSVHIHDTNRSEIYLPTQSESTRHRSLLRHLPHISDVRYVCTSTPNASSFSLPISHSSPLPLSPPLQPLPSSERYNGRTYSSHHLPPCLVYELTSRIRELFLDNSDTILRMCESRCHEGTSDSERHARETNKGNKKFSDSNVALTVPLVIIQLLRMMSYSRHLANPHSGGSFNDVNYRSTDVLFDWFENE